MISLLSLNSLLFDLIPEIHKNNLTLLRITHCLFVSTIVSIIIELNESAGVVLFLRVFTCTYRYLFTCFFFNS